MTVPAKQQHTLLPTLEELYNDDTLSTLRKESVFQVLVNQEPKKDWIKKHPMTGQMYMPIERVEWLLVNIFLKTRVEIKDTKQIANSVVVTVRLHYYNHIDNEWHWQDGIGAAPLQTENGAGAIEWDKIKSGAVQMGAPAAESYAIKDAAEKIGKLFGRDLNRADQTSFDALSTKFQDISKDDLKQLLERVSNNLSKDDLAHANRIIETNDTSSFKKLYTFLTSKVAA